MQLLEKYPVVDLVVIGAWFIALVYQTSLAF